MKAVCDRIKIWLLAAACSGCFVQCNNTQPIESGIAVTEETPAEIAKTVKETHPVLGNISALISGEYTRPQWSPDGRKILFTKEGNLGLYYVDVDNPGEIVELNNAKGAGYGAAWSKDGREVYYSEKENFTSTVKSISLETKTVAVHPEIHFSSIRSYAMNNGEGVVLKLDQKTLQVDAINCQTGKSHPVTDRVGQYYDPLLSPDKTKVAVHRDADILIFHADGSGLYKNLGKGIATGWSPDCKYVLAFLDESADGHQVSNSELYLLAADGSGNWRLTTTADVIEMWPSWNPVKNQIAFADHKTGRILIAGILLPE